jgi:hypothetical protein
VSTARPEGAEVPFHVVSNEIEETGGPFVVVDGGVGPGPSDQEGIDSLQVAGRGTISLHDVDDAELLRSKATPLDEALLLLFDHSRIGARLQE